MQLRKYYGSTMSEVLNRVKKNLGQDALILATRTLEPASNEARLNPGMKYEVSAAQEEDASTQVEPALSQRVHRIPAGHPVNESGLDRTGPETCQDLLRDLGILKRQMKELIRESKGLNLMTSSQGDLDEYNWLVDIGVDHEVLAPRFRSWLDWKMGPMTKTADLAGDDVIRASVELRMKGSSFSEWLWHNWSIQQGLDTQIEPVQDQEQNTGSNEVIALVGPSGVGKTTVMAKMASKIRRARQKNAVILTLDTHRFGTSSQWKKIGKLIDVPVFDISNQEDIAVYKQQLSHFDWIGIDTPSGLEHGSDAGQLLGTLMAQYPHLDLRLILPATNREEDNRHQMNRWPNGKSGRVMFSKIDETTRRGGIVNLTMDGNWKLDSFSTGTRIPQDLVPADCRQLWDLVLDGTGPVPDANCVQVGGMV
jgi:flagellar biosynthesis protein FlhF